MGVILLSYLTITTANLCALFRAFSHPVTRRGTLFHGDNIKMSDLHDLNFTAAYNLNDTFGAYLKFTNILSRGQDLWYGYPMQRFGFMGGININF